MIITSNEKKALKKRLGQLRKYMVSSLKKNKIDNYINTVNSRELRMLENMLIRNELMETLSIMS